MTRFRCPECSYETEALASEAKHHCPKRIVQAAPEKGKKRLPEWVVLERIDTHGATI